MKANRGLLILMAGLLIAAAPAVGQQGASGFAVDDPELYFGVLSLHQRHQEQIAAAKAAEAGRAKDAQSEDPSSASLHLAYAQQFGVTEADYDRVSRGIQRCARWRGSLCPAFRRGRTEALDPTRSFCRYSKTGSSGTGFRAVVPGCSQTPRKRTRTRAGIRISQRRIRRWV